MATDGSGWIRLGIRQTGDAIEIVVSNNGPKIPLEIREKIFDAHFSTKPGQRGYGLHFIRQITAANQGTVELLQEEDVTWRIRIPGKGEETA